MYGLCVPSRGKSGGLALLWPKQVNVLLQSFSHHHIDVSIQLLDSPFWWRFTGLYGEPDTGQREITWKLLSRLHDQSRREWLCAGDFNEILDQSEKLGGPPRPMWQMRKFREALEQCELVDLVLREPHSRGALGIVNRIRCMSDWIELVRIWGGPNSSRIPLLSMYL
ncbi:hypothetical protein Sango_1816700 [Sesamum angolense]|uniref:Endonuclease/exonuclease/phosphatase domain-containing protein n=1 Tax=Sesamum angolense TaxID=2727404 RepID=A0AAE1WHA0_9LAMI|nr:hypothetical protein Sango_1816700 [Sesamum angolense]